MQKSIKGLVASIATLHATKNAPPEAGNQGETLESVHSVVERVQIQFPSFDGSNFHDWQAKADQFFELEGTLEDQRGRLLLSMDGKEFSWQRHYM